MNFQTLMEYAFQKTSITNFINIVDKIGYGGFQNKTESVNNFIYDVDSLAARSGINENVYFHKKLNIWLSQPRQSIGSTIMSSALVLNHNDLPFCHRMPTHLTRGIFSYR